MEVDKERQGTQIKDALKADSVAVLLSQALQAQDRALLERCPQLALQPVPQEQSTLLLCPCTHYIIGIHIQSHMMPYAERTCRALTGQLT